ncbi:hypothetical protein OK016_25810 [Vibrio chagasii]|nr:hypothetical protein [Vibrio chagasii]
MSIESELFAGSAKVLRSVMKNHVRSEHLHDKAGPDDQILPTGLDVVVDLLLLFSHWAFRFLCWYLVLVLVWLHQGGDMLTLQCGSGNLNIIMIGSVSSFK